MKSLLIILLLCMRVFCSHAQERNPATATRTSAETFPSRIEMVSLGNDIVQFSASLPPLRQLAGAPKAYYSYFWEFGDGSFSDVNLVDRDKPKHRYKESGTYRVRLLATNNYASGISPTVTGQFNVKINVKSNPKTNGDFFSEKEKALNIKMKVNRNPKPGEDLMAYIGYRNRTGTNTSGSLVIFYNDQRFIHKSFTVSDKLLYNGELNSSLDRIAAGPVNPDLYNDPIANMDGRTRIAGNRRVGVTNGVESSKNFAPPPPYAGRARIAALRKKYLDYAVFNYTNLSREDQKFMFLKLQTLPDIIKDTNELISMTAMIIPEDPSAVPETYELTIQVLASHDPNQMQLVQNRINYRFMGKRKELTYKVDFQNIGKGPARNISIGIALPKQLNPATLKITGVSLALPPCDSLSTDESCMTTVKTTDSIYLLIKNIYLPGLEQNLVRNEDSTKGFIKYTINFSKRPKKIPFSSRAVIKFDNNTPIVTNSAKARFVKGISPAIIAGYNVSAANGNYRSHGPVQVGYVLAPYAPSRPYFQFEIFAGLLQEEELTSSTSRISSEELKLYGAALNRTRGNYPILLEYGERDTVYTKKRNTLQVVPLHFRYNLNNWMSVGVGLSGEIAITEKTTATQRSTFYGFYNQTMGDFDTTHKVGIKPKSGDDTKSWTAAKLAPFADIQFGRVRRTGPFVGLRYYRQLQGNLPNRFFAYAGFRL